MAVTTTNNVISIDSDKRNIRFNSLMVERRYPQYIYVRGDISLIATFLFDRGIHIDADLTNYSISKEEANVFLIPSPGYTTDNLLQAMIDYSEI